MSAQGHSPGNVPIVIRFKGGVKDQEELRSDEPEKGVNDANMIWSMTRKGAVGRHFDWYERDGSRHCYAVIDKLGTPDAIIVTCKYVGAG